MKEARIKSKRSFRGFFDEQIRYLDFKLSWWQRYKAHRRQNDQIDQSLDQLVNLTNKRIKIVNNYRKKLRKSVVSIERYVNSLKEKIIQEASVDKNKYSEEPFLQALFFEEKLCQQFFKTSILGPSIGETYSIVTSSPIYKEVFMPAMQDNEVIQDVRKTVLTFKHKRIEQSENDQPLLEEALHQFLLEKIVAQIKQELEPHMVTGYDSLKRSQVSNRALSPKEYLKAIIKLMKSPECLLWLDDIAVITDRFGVVDTELRETSFRAFNYIGCHTKHDASCAVCIVKS